MFVVLTAAYFFVYFHRVMTGTVGADVVRDLGGSIGVLSSIYFWTYALMQIPSGLLADRLGPRKATFIFLSIAAAGSLITCAADVFWMAVMGKMLIAAGMAVVYIPLMKLISVWFPKSDFALLNGIVISVGNVGAIAAAAPLEMLVDAVGWRDTFAALAVATAALAVLCLAVVRDHPHRKGLPGIEEMDFDDSGTPISDDTDARLPVAAGLRMVASGGRRFWPISIAYFFVYGSIMVFQGTWAKTYFDNVYDFAVSAAWIVTAIGVGKILSTVIIGAMSSRRLIRTKRGAMLFGSICFAATWGVIWAMAGAVGSYWFWVTVGFLFGFFGGFMTLSFTQVKEWYPVAISGTAVSAVNMSLFLGAAVCTALTDVVVGKSYALGNFTNLWLLMFAFSVIAAMFVFMSKEKKEDDVPRGHRTERAFLRVQAPRLRQR
jgi:sugar phosphate permease